VHYLALTEEKLSDQSLILVNDVGGKDAGCKEEERMEEKERKGEEREKEDLRVALERRTSCGSIFLACEILRQDDVAVVASESMMQQGVLSHSSNLV
jgi:hypothetical protein